MAERQIGEARTAGHERRNVTLKIVFMILAWFTISPLIMLINKNERYFKN